MKLTDNLPMDKLSPMMLKYLEIKKEHEGEILFFRLGDFYEMFFDDAVLVSRELELTLTGRDCGLPERAPMCGIPFHAAETYISRLIKKGYKVAICEQLEDPATAKGMVKRGVIRVITPGTLIESSLLEEEKNNYICSIYSAETGYGICFADVSTGEVNLTEIGTDENAVISELSKYMPNELIYNQRFLESRNVTAFIKNKLTATADTAPEESFAPDVCKYALSNRYGAENIKDVESLPLGERAAGALLIYLESTQVQGLERLSPVNIYSAKDAMTLNSAARANLELTETMRTREKRGSLLWVLDKTKTSMGKRKMRSVIERPLVSVMEIEKRLNAVDELFSDSVLLGSITAAFDGIYDIERLMTRIVYGNASPRDMVSLGMTFKRIPLLKRNLSETSSRLLQEIYSDIDPLEDVCKLIDESISEEPPIAIKDGGVIKKGFNKALDDLRYVSENTKDIIAAIETKERERTGIKNLKIGYNRVFGYYIDVTKSNIADVPPEYIRKQTLTNSERYITEELKDLEAKVLSAEQKIIVIETELFAEIKTEVAAHLERIEKTAGAVALLDVLVSFARVALENDYTRPVVDMSGELTIEDGRHPVVEKILSDSTFVPNDVDLDCDKKRIAIITGPNMAGKSTYMRQVALIVLMAQIGSFVPAKRAKIGIVDAIYTRVGASDDLSTGQSTFMVEMNEVAQILKNATKNSLLILDEIGRGTSTFDGMSIAQAIIEYIGDKKKLGAKTLFATHYHELTALESCMDCVMNYNIAVTKRGDDIIFLRRILPGGVDDSYGIEVSKLAGIPKAIINRAHVILDNLEKGKFSEAKCAKKAAAPAAQIAFGDEKTDMLKRRIRSVNPDEMTARDALNFVYELKKLAEE